MRESTAIQIMQIIAGLGCMGLGVAGIMLVGRGRGDADEHDVADYHEPAAPDRKQLIRDALVGLKRRHITVVVDGLPPAPSGMNAGSPLYAETLFRTWHPESPAVVAARMLREIADDERAKDGIGPDGHAWQLDGSCWADCPGCAYDMTGAFPVVRAA